MEKEGNFFKDVGCTILNSTIKQEVRCYKYTYIRDSCIDEYSIIGDFSKIDKSKLNRYVKIERFNHIYKTNIDSFTYTGPYTVIMESKIGKYSSISWGVTIGPAEHNYKVITSHSFLYNNYYPQNDGEILYNRFEKPCIIENDVWIGANVTILRGVTIHNGAVIGANSLVNKSIPPYAIAVGSPAKIIKYRFPDHVIKKLLELEWWNIDEKKIKENINLFSAYPTEEILEKLFEIKESS